MQIDEEEEMQVVHKKKRTTVSSSKKARQASKQIDLLDDSNKVEEYGRKDDDEDNDADWNMDEVNPKKQKGKTEQRAMSAAVYFAGDRTAAAQQSRKTMSSRNARQASEKKGSRNDSSLPLEGLTFVFTGILETMSRGDAMDLVKRKGAKVTTTVSGRTDYLVGGPVLDENGRRLEEGAKYAEALERGVKVLKGEQALKDLVEELNIEATTNEKTTSSVPEPQRPVPAPRTIATTRTTTKGKPEKAPRTSNNKAQNEEMNALWADKYAPTSVREILGNGDVVKKLRGWLENWARVHLGPEKSRKKLIPSRENPGAKAALISGPPGIGKTTLTTLVAKEMDYDILELNASDARSKNSLQSTLGHALDCPMLHLGGAEAEHVMKKRLVIMDEVDGLSGSDRGGSQELIKLIKDTKVPLICICNDRQSNKVKGLANSCFDLRAKRPMKQAIAKRLVAIASKEGIALEANAAELLAENCGNDIRQCLNALQMWATTCTDVDEATTARASTKATYAAMQVRLRGGIEKDAVLRFTAFDGAKMILSDHDRKSLYERTEAFFIDFGIASLLIWENYLTAATNSVSPVKNNTNSTARKDKIESVLEAADTLSLSDLIERKVRGDQNWNLLTTQAALIVKVGIDLRGRCMNPMFPRWFGKNSTRTKNLRLCGELAFHLGNRVSAARDAVRLEYLGAFVHVTSCFAASSLSLVFCS